MKLKKKPVMPPPKKSKTHEIYGKKSPKTGRKPAKSTKKIPKIGFLKKSCLTTRILFNVKCVLKSVILKGFCVIYTKLWHFVSKWY